MVRRAEEPGPSGKTWLRQNFVDVMTLLLTGLISVKFWCTFFGIENRLFVWAVIGATLTEAMRQVVVARRQAVRPRTISGERRFDLVAAILLGTGPWPVADILGAPEKAFLTTFHPPEWVVIVSAAAVLSCALSRFTRTLLFDEATGRTRSIRSLDAVPDVHVASMVFAPTAGRV
jgi:hypothetical protein